MSSGSVRRICISAKISVICSTGNQYLCLMNSIKNRRAIVGESLQESRLTGRMETDARRERCDKNALAVQQGAA